MTPSNKALLHAASTGDAELFETALEFGADLDDSTDKESEHTPVFKVGAQALYLSCGENHNLSIVHRLLELGVSVEAPCGTVSITPIYWAAYFGHDEMARLLLEHGAWLPLDGEARRNLLEYTAKGGLVWLMQTLLDEIEAKKSDEFIHDRLVEALSEAAAYGQVEIVQMLLNFGLGADSCVVDRDTPLLRAATQGNQEMVDFLLNQGADVWAVGWRRQTLLHCAAQSGLTELALWLLEQGLDPDAHDQSDQTPLHLAAFGSEVLARELVKRGANLLTHDNCNCSILHSASSGGALWLVSLVLDAGEDANLRDRWQKTPLMSAASAGHVEIMQLLVDHGADINAVAEYDHNTALWNAASRGQTAAVEWLISHGADMTVGAETILTELNQAPLGVAAAYNHLNTVECLLRHGADLEAGCAYGGTALYYAAEMGAKEAVELLLQNGAQVNAETEEGSNPLMTACESGGAEVVQLLLKHGADIERGEGWYGDSVLHGAVRHRDQAATVELLLARGANPQALNKQGETPLDLAEAAGHLRSLKILRAAL